MLSDVDPVVVSNVTHYSFNLNFPDQPLLPNDITLRHAAVYKLSYTLLFPSMTSIDWTNPAEWNMTGTINMTGLSNLDGNGMVLTANAPNETQQFTSFKPAFQDTIIITPSINQPSQSAASTTVAGGL